MSAEILGAKSISARILGAKSVIAQILGAKVIGAQMLSAEVLSAKVLSAKIPGAEIHGAKIHETQIHHYLSKTLNYEDFEMKIQDPNIKPGMVAPFLKKIKELSEDVMDKLIYQNMPELEECVEGHDTVDMISEVEGMHGDDVVDFSPDPAFHDERC